MNYGLLGWVVGVDSEHQWFCRLVRTIKPLLYCLRQSIYKFLLFCRSACCLFNISVSFLSSFFIGVFLFWPCSLTILVFLVGFFFFSWSNQHLGWVFLLLLVLWLMLVNVSHQPAHILGNWWNQWGCYVGGQCHTWRCGRSLNMHITIAGVWTIP